jgi:hypothetical protein
MEIYECERDISVDPGRLNSRGSNILAEISSEIGKTEGRLIQISRLTGEIAILIPGLKEYIFKDF